MNLHNIVSGATGSVNPPITAQVQQSNGYTTLPSGERVPAYLRAIPVTVQRQELSFKELQMVDGLNMQGIFCSLYLNGDIYGVDRGTARGGDLFTFGGKTWLVVTIAEQWADWCRVILCAQIDGQRGNL